MSKKDITDIPANDDTVIVNDAVDNTDISPETFWKKRKANWDQSWMKRKLKVFDTAVKKTWGYRLFQQMNDYKFFPKFMAARGGITAVAMGGFMMAGIVVSGVSAFAIAMAATGIGLIVFGTYGAVTYGGRLLKDGYNKLMSKIFKKSFNEAAQKKEGKPKPAKKKTLRPFKILEESKIWQDFIKTPFAQKVMNSKGYKMVSNMMIWKHLSYIGKDQEVRMRAFATSGAIATIASAGTILAAQTVALPVLTISAASLLTLWLAAGVVGGSIALYQHTGHFIKSIKNALQESSKNQRAKKQQLENTPSVKMPEGAVMDIKNDCKDDFAQAATAIAGNDNKAVLKKAPVTSKTKKGAPKKG